ncbi:MAG TPA: RDD family protein [Thermoanaerobaculia bacterium]|jgi:Predicted membrane protein/domain|nr:RDD family protein [Thermoanaerobaculia bacterium]
MEQREDDALNKYHTFWLRFCAGLIDSLVFLPIDWLDDVVRASVQVPAVLIVWSILRCTAFWLYNVLLHARYGQTLGKMVVGVKVLDVNEQSTPTLRQAFLRDIVYIILNTLGLGYMIYLIVMNQYSVDSHRLTLPLQMLGGAAFGWSLLELITMLTNSKRRALHDWIAGTVVVRETRAAGPITTEG